MAKYLDNDGLSHFLAKLRLTFSKIGHTHSVSVTTGDSVSVTAGTAASLTTTAISIPNISKKTVVTGGTTTSVPNVTSVGTASSASVANGVLTLTNSTVPTLGTAIAAYTGLTTGDSITVGTATSAKAVNVFTPNTPTAVTKKTVVTSVGGTTGASTN